MNYSANDFIRNNDFEGAKEKLEQARPRWKKHWFETCQIIFEKCSEWSKRYVLDTITQTITKIVDVAAVVFKLRNKNIAFSDDCIVYSNDEDTQKCYLIEFFNKFGESICSKVGTTKRKVQTRIREELNSNTYKKMGAESCVIHRVYDCGEIPAEGLESFFRAKYIRRYPTSFYKNDRFIKQTFDLAEADKIFDEYMAMA